MSELLTNCNTNCKYYSTYECLKPNGLVCPHMSTTVYQVPQDKNEELWGVTTVKEDSISYLTKRCAICENDIEVNSPEIICDECKEAIKKLKEMLNNGK